MAAKRTDNSDLEIFDRIVERCLGRDEEMGLLTALRPFVVAMNDEDRYIYKDSVTGRIVTAKYASMNPGQTYKLRVRRD